ncbi:MAG: trigger factor [Thermodesulfovibrionales bacterium]
MLKAIEEISSTKKRLTIEIPAETIEKEITDSLESLRKTTHIPGFRTGKAPMSLIEKRFGKKVEDEVLGKVISRAYVDALNEADLTPVTDPIVEEQTEFKRQSPFLITMLIETLPKINLNYEGIKVKDIPVSVTDEDVESVLKGLQEDRATYEPSDEPVAENDLILCDYSIEEAGIEKKDQVYKIGGPLFPEDVVKNLIGKGKGSELVMETTFPETYPYKELAGKKVEMKLTIKDVKKGNLPQLDDEFAKDIGFNSLEELKDHLRQEVLRLKNSEVARIQKAEIINKLLETHEFDIPETLLDEEIAMLASSYKNKAENRPDEDSKRLNEEVRAEAVRNLKTTLLLSLIGKKEDVRVSEDDMKNAIIAMARRFSVSPENIMKFYISRDGSLDRLKDSIFEEKVLDLLLNKASVEKGEEN